MLGVERMQYPPGSVLLGQLFRVERLFRFLPFAPREQAADVEILKQL